MNNLILNVNLLDSLHYFIHWETMIDYQKVVQLVFSAAPTPISGKNREAHEIFDCFISYLQDDSSCIIQSKKNEKKYRSSILGCLPAAFSQSNGQRPTLKQEPTLSYVSYHCEDGCAILLTRQKQNSPIKLEIIMPQGWVGRSKSSLSGKLVEANPIGYISISKGVFENFTISLKQLADQIEKKLEFKSSRRGINRIEQAIEDVLTKSQNESFSRVYSLSEYHFRSQNRQPQFFLKSIGAHGMEFSQSEANTAWHLVQALLKRLNMKSKDKKESCLNVGRLIAGFKVYLMSKATSVKKIQGQKIEFYKKCVDELIFYYKKAVGFQDKSYLYFQQLIQNILKNMGGTLTTKINQTNVQIPSLENPEPLSLKIPVNQIPFEVKQNKIDIKVCPFTVDERFPFSELLEIYQKEVNQQMEEQLKNSLKNQWVLLVERTFFSLAAKLCSSKSIRKNYKGESKGTIDVKIHSSEIQTGYRASNIIKVLQKYQHEVTQSQKYLLKYGMGMQSQALSHIVLIKAIACAVTFQGVKLNRQQCNEKLQAYRIPINIQQIYRYFYSLKDDAHRAMRHMMEYWEPRKLKQSLFILNGDVTSFKKFAVAVSNQTRNILNYYSEPPTGYYHWLQNDEDRRTYCFLRQTPSDILGLMKVCYLAQFRTNTTVNIDPNYQIWLNFHETMPLRVLISKTGNAGTGSISVYFDTGCQLARPIQESDMFKPVGEYKDSRMNNFLVTPNNSANREHQAYAYSNLAPDEVNQREFIAQGITRSTLHTQLTLLCENFLSRKFKINCFNPKQTAMFAEEVFLHTAGHLQGYNKDVENYFGSGKIFLQTFLDKVWQPSYKNCIHILAPFISCLCEFVNQGSRDIISHKGILFKISKQIFQSFLERREQLTTESTESETQAESQAERCEEYLRFICLGSILCFREINLEIQDTEEIQHLARLIFYYSQCVVLSKRGNKKNTNSVFQEMDLALEQTIYNNIETITNYMKRQDQKFNSIVRELHKNFPVQDFNRQGCTWQVRNSYIFSCTVNNRTYEVDLYRGLYFINGKSELGLNPQIRNNGYFREIFGQNKDFRVMQPEEGYLETEYSINSYLGLDETDTKAYLRFSTDGKIIQYFTVSREKQRQVREYWELVDQKQLLDQSPQNKYLPQIFTTNYFPWINRDKNCIVFRGKQFLSTFKNIGMVIHLEENLIDKAFYLHNKKNRKLLSLSEMGRIYDKTNPDNYPMITLRRRRAQKQIKIFQMLSKFQPLEFILELQQGGKTYFQLHRYRLRFQMKTGPNELASENYFGYSLDCSYIEQQDCIYNRIDCLVLKKHANNTNVLNNHERIVLISDGKLGKWGKIEKKDFTAASKIGLFKYDLHDYFGDLRGATRTSQMHLASLIATLHNGIMIEQIGMTALEYSIYILKSCMTNRPFSTKELQIFKRFLNIDNEQILLLCKALWKAGHYLKDFLSFFGKQNKGYKKDRNIAKLIEEEKKQKKLIQIIQKEMVSKQNQMIMAETMHQNNIEDQRFKYNQMLDGNMIRLLILKKPSCWDLFDYNDADEVDDEDNDDDDSQLEATSSHFKYEESVRAFWKSENAYKIKNIFSLIQKKDKQLLDLTRCQANEQVDLQVFDRISKIASENRQSTMLKNKLEEEKASYEIAMREKSKHDFFIINLAPTIEGAGGIFQTVNQIQSLANECIKYLDQVFDELIQKNKSHCDVISGYRPLLSKVHFTKILCSRNKLSHFFPNNSQKENEDLQKLIKIWMGLQTRLASMKRLQILLKQKSKKNDVAILRQIQSPRAELFLEEQGMDEKASARKQIQQNLWICFQAENKVQARLEQYQIFNHLNRGNFQLIDGKKGIYCQLNMGEGKTQIIIPMLILSQLLNPTEKKVPRINLLSSLYEEARGNFFRFLSVTGFRIPVMEIPFSREVDLIENNIFKAKNFLDCFGCNYYILTSRESRLSESLCYQEQASKQNSKQTTLLKKPIVDNKIIDIFDEIDQMMTPKKFYIYSIGKALNLPDADIRIKVIEFCIEVFLKDIVSQGQDIFKSNVLVADEPFIQIKKDISEGSYPRGLRLTPHEKIEELLKSLLVKILSSSDQNSPFKFYNSLPCPQKQEIQNYILNPAFNERVSIYHNIPEILALRGLFAFDLFQHCFSQRCGVRFGVPGSEHQKYIAVPYENANTPSKTSQFEHSEVAILFTFISYYVHGLTFSNFKSCLQLLMNLPDTQRNSEYSLWVKLAEENKPLTKYRNIKQIELNSNVCLKETYTIFGKNRKTIAFWLKQIVFQRDLKHYEKSLTASAYDLADATFSVGFSGTKDNREVLPGQLQWDPPQHDNIKATDGKMIYLMTENATQFEKIGNDDQVLWKRFLQKALDENAGCIIDAGALCVGVSMKEVIVPWIADNIRSNQQLEYLGISFCDQQGRWQIYDLVSKKYIDRATTIPDFKTFAIFDEARSRGADLNLDTNVVAALSLSRGMTKDKLMQAAGRLRKLGRNQSIILMATEEITNSIQSMCKKNSLIGENMVEYVIAWCMINSVLENEGLLIQSAHLALEHACFKLNGYVSVQKPTEQTNRSLKSMYQQAQQRKTVGKIVEKMIRNYCSRYSNILNLGENKEIDRIKSSLTIYSTQSVGQFGSVTNICERKVQICQQTKKQVTPPKNQNLQPITEDDSLCYQPFDTNQLQKLLPFEYEFSEAFSCSFSIIQTTENKNDKNRAGENWKLSEVYFVMIDKNSRALRAITLRETEKWIMDNLVKKKQKLQEKPSVFLLSQLENGQKTIQMEGFDAALIDCLILAGRENFQEEQKDYILNKMMSVQKKHPKTQIKKLFCGILVKRNEKYRFKGSSLQRFLEQLQHHNIQQQKPQQLHMDLQRQRKQQYA